MTGYVYWWEWVDWQATATLVTGLSAVSAALFVGLKQSGVARRQVDIAAQQVELVRLQTNILAKQADLEKMKLREALFDDRFEVYEAAQRWLGEIIAHAADARPETTQNFLRAMDRAKFLFRPSVHKNLRKLWTVECNRHMHAVSQGNRRSKAFSSHVEGEHDALTALVDAQSNLPKLFGSSMKLWYDPDKPEKDD